MTDLSFDNQSYDKLNKRELEILDLLAQGYSDRAIADQLVLAYTTIKWYNRQIFNKLGVDNRQRAVEFARKLGLLRDHKSDSPKHNLPAQMTPFVGRDHELAELAALLRDEPVRMVTILAFGGMGKTRLALALAQKLLPDFTDGVYFVLLAPLVSSEQLVVTIADALNLQFSPGNQTPKRQLLNFLRNKQLLLILDNFEHLLEDAPLITEILQAGDKIKILVTSREKLNLNGEIIYSLVGLPYPEQINAKDALYYGAVELFLQCARRAQRHFVLDKSDDVIRICQLIQGMPLAIELAAAWMDTLSPAEIVNEINRNLDFLRTDMRDVPERLRSMRVIFQAAWNRLTDEEQAVFRKLSVFRGGCTREAAKAVTGADVTILSKLVNKALLWRASDGRYDIHELLRQFGEEQLNTSPTESRRTHELHGIHYADFMQRQWEKLKSAQMKAAMQMIETEIDNIRSAWRWAVQYNKAEEIGKTLASFEFFYDAKCWFDEGLQALDTAARTLAATNAEELVYGQVLMHYGYFCSHLMRFNDGRALVEESLTIFRRLGARQDIAYALGTLASFSFFGGDVAEVDRLFEESFTLFKVVGDRRGMAWALEWKGNVALYLHHNYARAREFANESIALYKKIGEIGRIDQVFAIQAWCAYFSGDFSQAKYLHQECLQNASEFGFVWPIMEGYLGLGMAELALGEHEQAALHCYEGLTRVLKIGNWAFHLIPMALAEIAVLLIERGEKIKALEYLALALHPPIWGMQPPSQNRAQQLLTKLKMEVSSDIFAAAVQRGQTLDLQTAVESLLAYLKVIQGENPAGPTQAKPDIVNTHELEIL